MVVVATDAPIDARNLKRLASRAVLGLGVTGSPTTNGSGEYVIAFPTAPAGHELLSNNAMSPLFQAVKEATEEAIYNSLFVAQTTTGYAGHKVEALPIGRVLEILRRHDLLGQPRR
jgi:D-aminopeptidase